MLTQKQVKALARLADKLSVVRKSLRGDERQLFDQIVTAAAFEVEEPEVAAHRMQTAAQSGAARNAEVAAHSLQSAAQSGAARDAEVAAHSLQAAAATSVSLGLMKNAFRVTMK